MDLLGLKIKTLKIKQTNRKTVKCDLSDYYYPSNGTDRLYTGSYLTLSTHLYGYVTPCTDKKVKNSGRLFVQDPHLVTCGTGV